MRIQNLNNQPNCYEYNPRQNFRAEPAAVEGDIGVQQKEKLNEKEKNSSGVGSSVTIATILTVVCAIMLSRGFQKNLKKYLNKLKIYMEHKKENLSPNASKKNEFYNFSIRRANDIIKKTDSINNITSLKDILFMKLMYKTKPTKKIHKSITNYFEKLSQNTVYNSYKETDLYFANMNKLFNKLDEHILKNSADELVKIKEGDALIRLGFEPDKSYTKRELVTKARSYRDKATTIVKAFMSKDSLEYRHKYINDIMSDLYSKFWDVSFKDFWSKNNKFKRKDMWQTFIAAEQVKGDKTYIANIAATARNAITYSKADKVEQLCDCISKLDGIVPPNDIEGAEIIKRLEWFSRHSELIKENKEIFKKELEKLKNHEINMNNKELAKTLSENKTLYTDTIESLLEDNSTGEIQDMLSIYYKIAPYELSKSGALHAVKKASKSFDKSVNLESIELFDKIRDLRLGSAPTDVLTIIFSFLALSFGLGYAHDKDERLSTMFKAGIPIVGGIFVAVLTATKLVSGGKSLALGFISGLALNQFGKITDFYRKKIS